MDGQIAQSVEQRTENPCVGGSIPSLPTQIKGMRNHPFFVEENPCVGGSQPKADRSARG